MSVPVNLQPLPASLKPIQHYLKTATEHDKRDPVVAYYCRLYALEYGMKIDKSSQESKLFYVSLLDYLERTKKTVDEDAIRNEVVGQAHMENYALKVFLFADTEDRAGRFNKNVVKSYYTCSMLFDTLTVFGEISEDIDKNRKYAKWKAAYIHRCLKNGETPVAGPIPEEGEDASGGAPIGFEQAQQPMPGPSGYQPGPSGYQPAPGDSNSLNLPGAGPAGQPIGSHAPPSTPQEPQNKPSPSQATYNTDWTPPKNASGVQLSVADYQQCKKYCKYATSALDYEDASTAIDNLTKALKLLTTGQK